MISGSLEARYGDKFYADPGAAVAAVQADLTKFVDVALSNAGRRAMERYLKLIAGRIIAKHSRPYPAGATAMTLSSRSGRAAKSIKESVRVTENLNEVIGYIGGEYYLKSHEFSATIRARRSKYLTIPLPAALNSNGTPKKRRARDWAHTFVRKSKNGNLLIFQKQGDKIVPLYVLKKSVFIPARLGMGKELIRYTNLFFSFVEQEVRKEFKI